VALYQDRQSIFAQNSRATQADSVEQQLAGTQGPSQFGRWLEELEISCSRWAAWSGALSDPTLSRGAPHASFHG